MSYNEYLNEKPRFLNQAQAERRRQQFVEHSINYKLQLRLDKGEKYQGVVEVEFNLTNAGRDLFIDYQGSSIEKVVINKAELGKAGDSYLKQIWNGLFVKLPTHYLNNGRNVVTIVFSNEYSNDGCGLHSFTDTDGKQYLYSQCEPYWCNRIFPSFDQPDLKATLEATIVAPKDWVILSNELKSHEAQFSQQDYKTHNPTMPYSCSILGNIPENNDYHYAVFNKTQLYPTYLFGFVAGLYGEIKCEQTYNNIPMSLYCRQSLIVHLQNMSDWLFASTIESMKLYEDLFGYPYPYHKYDQVFCPEYNMGAMENTGLVTFNDLYIFREEKTASSYTSFLNTVTHELSHHWFGNLVTMKWWNDLWLNESFADFISHYIISKMTVSHKPLTNIWIEFNLRKSWGYRTDQLNTTHPIACLVENTEAADSIFDGISYSKGSATLRQLMSLMGDKPFSDALKKYFKKFEFRNTVLDDLIEFFDHEFKQLNLGFSLHEWQKSWIQTAGLNECQPVFNPEDRSANASLKIIQTPALPQHPTLRRHKLQVAFFDENANITTYPILLNEAHETVLDYDASKTQFKGVLLNYGDWGFIKVLLDDISIEFFKLNLHKITDIVTRTLIWRAFFDMVRDGKLSSEEYIDIFINAIPNESSDDIITSQLQYLQGAFSSFTPEQYKLVLGERVFNFLLKYLLSIQPENKNRIIAVRDKLDGFARSDAHIAKLLAWYNGTDEDLKNIEVGLSVQWRIVSLVHKSRKYTREEKASLFKKQAERDPSDTSKNYEQKCRALDVNAEEREKLWNFYFSAENTLSVRNLEYSWSGFNSSFNHEELEPYFEKFFEKILHVYDNKPKEFANDFYQYLLPNTEDYAKLISRLENLLSNLNEKYVFLQRYIKESIDDCQRKQRTHNCFRSRAPLAKNN
ncbi:hypothetical protein ABPG72_004436 [Tetrahymena utriculariae]